MKIAILTVYDGINFGSYLQAFAMQKLLREMGHEIYFIQRYTPEENLKLFTSGRSHNRKLIDKVKIKCASVISNIRNPKRIKYFLNEYSYFVESWKRFEFIKIDQLTEIDLIVCGSDEIWNFNNPVIDVPFYTCTSFDVKCPKVAFAISAGDSTIDQFKNNPNVVRSISEFTTLLPRDDNTKKILEQILNKKFEKVCDPTLLIEKDAFINDNERLVKEPYLFVYAYSLLEEEKANIIRFSREHNLKVVTAANYLDIADETLLIDPMYFANLIKNAEYCYTSTFHGTVFCLQFAKHFCCKSKTSKIIDLLHLVNETKYLWNGDSTKFDEIMSFAVNHEEIDRCLDEIRKKSKILISYSLEIVKNGSDVIA